MEYKYKYTSKCNTCKFLRRHPKVKGAILTEIKLFNPQSILSTADFIRKYSLPVDRQSLTKHCQNHITKLDKHVVEMINDKQPIKKLSGEIVLGGPKEHERPLDALIGQFYEKVSNRELPITVKDGLAAIKIKADIVSKDKDRQKDILKLMSGAYDESGRPPERTTA